MVTSQILTMDHLPFVNQAYSIIILEEGHCIVVHNKEERTEAIAFAVRSIDKSSIFCHCVIKQDIRLLSVIKSLGIRSGGV